MGDMGTSIGEVDTRDGNGSGDGVETNVAVSAHHRSLDTVKLNAVSVKGFTLLCPTWAV